ncbi:FAD-dependent oxidoreductase [Ornithinibacillus sp. L9]|uniref:FAD-dependent oxidoreductase n=1 Tax=Ornithinibacillus caprae TaxID=2678566 RepID=A0A6N8FJJ1_9BACI|nr:FAD-binding oxidoreductase [Ornithinibacillus caprae]MUK87508.1 FAD-dependent oxidoreductase [Ornithinibacillus caprae]
MKVETYDAIVIGAGVVGLGITYELSKQQGLKTLTIDQGYPMSGTSGATQAWIWVHSKTPYKYGQLSLASANRYQELQEEIGDIEYIRSGGIAPIFSKQELYDAKALQLEMSKANIPVDLLSREEILKLEPNLSPNLLGATYSPIDGHVNPFKLIQRYHLQAKINGAHFSFYNGVRALEKTEVGYKVTTNRGVYEAEKVILSAGLWSKSIGEFLNIRIPTHTSRGQILVTEPTEPLIHHVIIGMRQLSNGIVLMGFSKEDVGYDRRTTMDVLQDTAEKSVNLVPKLKDVKIVRSFSGIRVMPNDGLPIFGEVSEQKNLYVAVTHSGMTLSAILGKSMAELVTTGESSFPMEAYSIERFKGREENQ